MRRMIGAALALAVISAVLVTTQVGSAQGPDEGGRWREGDPGPRRGVHLAVWEGGTLEQAAATPGARSMWATQLGRLAGYVVGAPTFVNARFRALFPDGSIPKGTPLLLVLGESAHEAPAEVIEAFLESLDRAAPPTGAEDALVQALVRLTERTRAHASSAGDLAAFLGLQDLPDRGASMESIAVDHDRARIHVVLHYSGGDTEREFLLLRERDRWCIDWVDPFPVGELSDPARVAEAFLLHAFASAPPAGLEQPAARAAELLTDDARSTLDSTAALAGALAAFIHVQDVPDQGLTLAPASVADGRASVVATLHYSGGDTTRTLHLVKAGDGWRVDTIGLP